MTTTTTTGPQAQEAVIPAGWLIRREGDEISVCAPQATPGMTYVKPGKGRLEARLLYALADALLTTPPTPARVVSDEDLPELPDPEVLGFSYYDEQTRTYKWTHQFTVDQMRAYARAALSTLQSGAEGKDWALPELIDASEFAHGVLQEIYVKYQLKIGPFATQANKASWRLGLALRAIKDTALQPGQEG